MMHFQILDQFESGSGFKGDIDQGKLSPAGSDSGKGLGRILGLAADHKVFLLVDESSQSFTD